jgi:gliding motility-associated-like protein
MLSETIFYMKSTIFTPVLLILLTLISFEQKSFACSPCGALSNVSQTLNGTTLALEFTSNAGWKCCYTVKIEIVCVNQSFTGVPNFFSQEMCLGGGGCSSCTYNVATPYPTTFIDLSGFCPGEYKWRASETSCNIYTPTYTFTLGGVSPIVLNASLSQPIICLNGNSQLNANASNGCNNGTFTYSWSPATGLSNPNIANPVAAPTQTTTYTVTVTETGSCTLPQSSSVTLTVNPLPTATIAGDATVCEGDTPPEVTLTGSDGVSPYTFNYSINGVPTTITSTGNTATIPVATTTSQSYAFNLISVEDGGTPSCAQNQTGTVNVSVTSLPQATIEYALDNYCATGSAQVSLVGTSGGTYSSTSGLDLDPTTGGINLATSAPGPYTVTYDVVNGICSNTTTTDLTIYPLPVATIEGSVELCLGDDDPTIVLYGAGGTSPYTVNYMVNGFMQTPLVIAQDSALITIPANLGTTTVNIVDVMDASPGFCFQQSPDTVTIVVHPNPIVDAGEDQVLCEPGSSTPSEVTLSGEGAVTYQWDNGVTDGVAFTPPLGTTVFTVIGTDANGCIGSDDVSITSLPQPEALGNPSNIFGHVTLNTMVENQSLYATNYVWTFGDGDTLVTNSNETVNHSYPNPGIYEITLTASNGICVDTWAVLVEALAPMVVTPPNVFTPNGDGSNEQYFVNVINGDKFQAWILNRWGNVVAELTDVNQGWDGKTDGKDVSEGVYFVKYVATDFSGNEVTGHTFFHLIR